MVLDTAGQHEPGHARLPRRRRAAGGNRPRRVPKISVSRAPVTISQAIKVTKWSTFTGDLHVSEQQAEQSSTETGSLSVAPEASSSVDAKDTPVIASALETGGASPTIAPDREAPKPHFPKINMPKAEAFRVEPANPDTAGRAEPDVPRMPGKLMIMSPGERAWHGEAAAASKAEPSAGSSGKRRFGAMAAVVALATVAGAGGGARAASRSGD